MHVGRRNSETNYLMNNQVISKTKKDIEVLIHKSLKPSLQCKEAARKANHGVLTQIAHSFHDRDRKTFLNPQLKTHTEFSTPSAWNPWLQQDQEVLENVQTRAVTRISGLSSNNYEDRLKELHILSLKDRRIQFDMVQTFKIVHEIDRVDKRV